MHNPTLLYSLVIVTYSVGIFKDKITVHLRMYYVKTKHYTIANKPVFWMNEYRIREVLESVLGTGIAFVFSEGVSHLNIPK